MKTLVSILLLASLFLPVLGMFGWLHYQKRVVRKEIKHRIIEGIDREELVLLSFTTKTAANLRWEHAREFEYQGEMYDVVETVVEGDTTHYWCWPDKEESKLNRHLATLTQQAMNQLPQRQDQQGQLLAFFKSLYIHSDRADSSVPLCLQTVKATLSIQKYTDPHLTFPSPPPRLG